MTECVSVLYTCVGRMHTDYISILSLILGLSSGSVLVADTWTDNYQIMGLLEKPPKQTRALGFSPLSFILWSGVGWSMMVWENESKSGMGVSRMWRLQVGSIDARVAMEGEVACVRVWKHQNREQWRQRVNWFSESSSRVIHRSHIWTCGFWQCFRLNVFVHAIS